MRRANVPYIIERQVNTWKTVPFSRGKSPILDYGYSRHQTNKGITNPSFCMADDGYVLRSNGQDMKWVALDLLGPPGDDMLY